MIIYIFSQNYEDMVLRFFQRLGSGTQKEFISKAGDFIILRKEENSQPTIKPNFISGALIPYLHGHVKFCWSRDLGNSFFLTVHSAEKEFVDHRPKYWFYIGEGKIL